MIPAVKWLGKPAFRWRERNVVFIIRDESGLELHSGDRTSRGDDPTDFAPKLKRLSTAFSPIQESAVRDREKGLRRGHLEAMVNEEEENERGEG